MKKILDKLNHCYALTYFKTKKGKEYVIYASEEVDKCIAYDINNNYEKTIVWNEPGGTMSLVVIPDEDSFLATQKFYPGFNSKETIIVKTDYKEGKFITKKICDFPYLHRFDLIKTNEKILFIGCTICTSKKSIDDWSDPGKIYIGEYDSKEEKIVNLKIIQENVLKNHGYYRKDDKIYIASESGIYIYKISDNDIKKVDFIDIKASEVTLADINGDGIDEYITIEKFHGNKIRVYDKNLKMLYEYPNKIDFAHVILPINIENKNYVLCGVRDINKELFIIKYNNNYDYEIIDENVGSSNAIFINNKVYVANREISEVAIYNILERGIK